MRKQRRYSIEFKRQVGVDYLGEESASALARRHDLSRHLVRVWVEKAEAGELDRDVAAADLLVAYEAKVAAWSGWSASRRWNSRSLKSAGTRPVADKRELVRDHRPDGLSARRGCALMGLARSRCYVAPARPSDHGLVAEMQAITDEFEA